MRAELPSTRRGSLAFYKRYTIVMVSVFLAVLLSLGSFFAYRLAQQFQNEVHVVEFYVDGNGQLLDYLFRSTLDQLQLMRLDMETLTTFNDQCAFAAAEIDDLFVQTEDGFALRANANAQWHGQIVGLGSLENRQPSFYCALRVALALRDEFAETRDVLSAVDNAYFVSTHGFYLVAPAMTLDDLPNPAQIQDQLSGYFENIKHGQISHPTHMHDIQTLLSRKHGPAIPISTPIYIDGELAGSLSFGLSIEFINRMNQKQSYPAGSVYLINALGEILVHPEIDSGTLTSEAASISEIAPDRFPPIDTLATLPHATAAYHERQIIITYRLNAVPWTLAFVVPEDEVRNKILRNFGPAMLGVLAALAIMMLAGYWVTSRYYIRPAAKLINHVYHESNFDPQPLPEVPSDWRPWFEAITRAFHQSLELNNLHRELDIAARLQASLLPRHWPNEARYALWGRMLSAKEVGGDFYDYLPLEDGKIAIVVADVSGKGIPAGLFGMVSKTYLRSFALDTKATVSEIVERANKQLCQDNDTCMFVTALYAEYDPDTGLLQMVNAGHPPQLLIRAGGQASWVKPSKPCTALGVLPTAAYSQTTLTLAPGDQLLIFSDGVTEAMNTLNEEFGFERLLGLFDQQTVASAKTAVEMVFQAIGAHETGTERSDDITCLALQRLS